MNQRFFDDVKFEWDGDWYKLTKVDAKTERAIFVKYLKEQGFNPRLCSLGTQLLSKGGIGSGKPHIEYTTKCYGVNW